ncbi:MAG: tripartite tricarboxylate transporter substrate binding protein [Variovorax sp.]
MTIDRRKVLGGMGALGIWSGGWVGDAAMAQAANDFPTRTVKLVLPFTPGNPADLLLRLLATRLTEVWKQPVIVENKPGAGANIGIEYVAKSPADGYTVLCTNSNFVANPSVYPNVRFDPLKDFAPVTGLIKTPAVLLVAADSPIQSVQDLIARAKAEPGKLSYASGGVGTLANFSGELFKSAANIEALHVPYKGIPEILTSLLGKVTDFAFPVVASTLSHVRSGKFRALAVTSAQRMKQLPDVPTMHEAMPGSGFDVGSENGLAVPAGTPPAVIQMLHAEITKIMRDPTVADPLIDLGYQIIASTPAEFGATLVQDVKKFDTIAKKVNLKVE